MSTARNRQRVTGAILAGGCSARMGAPKQNVLLPDGRSMIEPIAEAMSPVCDQVVIVGRCGALPDLRRIADLRPGEGPLAGIEALLASNLDEQYLICPCDLPLISPEMLRPLTAEMRSPATVFAREGPMMAADSDAPSFHPLPARLSAAALGEVRGMLDRGQRAVWRLIQRLGPTIVPAPQQRLGELRNVNTPEALRMVQPEE